jgi:hypothetical protein
MTPTLFTDALPPPDQATERAYFDLYLRYRERGGALDFPAYVASIGQMHEAVIDGQPDTAARLHTELMLAN